MNNANKWEKREQQKTAQPPTLADVAVANSSADSEN